MSAVYLLLSAVPQVAVPLGKLVLMVRAPWEHQGHRPAPLPARVSRHPVRWGDRSKPEEACGGPYLGRLILDALGKRFLVEIDTSYVT